MLSSSPVLRAFVNSAVHDYVEKKHSPMKKVTECDSSCCVGFRYFMAFLLSSSAKCFMNISSTSSAKFITCLIHEKLIRRTFNHFTYVHKILAPDTRQIMPDKWLGSYKLIHSSRLFFMTKFLFIHWVNNLCLRCSTM